MTRYELELGQKARDVGLTHGADLVGVVKVSHLPEHVESMYNMLPEAKSVLVVISRHSRASIGSSNNQLAQFDTIHTYNECARAAHNVSRFLESEGFASAAIPGFIPIDMQDPKNGMRGEICWRRAGVRAGLGSYGENGLLVTREFGSAIRISGLLTAADLEADAPLEEEACTHCRRCIEACPTGALLKGRKINKKLCGDKIFKYGFRFFQQLMEGVLQEPTADIHQIIRGYELRELWQTFMTGNYYFCFQCQAQCPSKFSEDAG